MRSVARRIALALAVVLAIILAVITSVVLGNATNNHLGAPVTMPTATTSAMTEWDKQQFASLMAERRSGYDCPKNDAVVQAGGPIYALVLCPDYTVRITFISDDPANPPKVEYFSSDPDPLVKPITVSFTFGPSCGNDDTVDVCSNNWQVQWTFSADPTIVPLGENMQGVVSHDGSGHLWWTGVSNFGSGSSVMGYSAANIRTLEIYAGSSTKSIVGTPLTVDRRGSFGS